MNNWVEMVTEFHKRFRHPVNEKGYIPTIREDYLRRDLLFEEVTEYAMAESRVEKLDALADIIVLAIGTALLYGFDIDTAMARVHESNMSKLGEDGRPIYREDWKILKGPHYHKPYLDDLV